MNSPTNLVNPDGASVLPVSEIVLRARRLLEGNLPLCWISGEVSNLTRAASGHFYFTLKDDSAQLRCTMWRTRAQLLPFQLREGMQVDVRAQLTVYEPRGDLQLSVEQVRQAGAGNLFEALLRLKSKLEREGLFDAAERRALPALPGGIGIITSPAAAALRDVLITLKRRAPGLRVVIYPTLVQGEQAGARIAEAIHTASRRAVTDGIEALILCRGGGSMEDLWAFNEEAVVRAIRATTIPVVSGVGHETDTCLCDFAADLRAATPTAAAEALSEGHLALRTRLPQLARTLRRAGESRLARAQQGLDLAERSLRHPQQKLAMAAARLTQLQLRLQHVGRARLQSLAQGLQRAEASLLRCRPQVKACRPRLDALEGRLRQAMLRRQEHSLQRLAALAASLDALNPSSVLQRGYAIVSNAQGDILRDASALRAGDQIRVQLAEGSADAEIREVHSEAQSR